MPYSFTPIPEEQLEELSTMRLKESILPEGMYDFSVESANEKTSKAGNDMIQLVLTVYKKDGKTYKVFDNIMMMESWIFKLKRFCDTTEMSDKYNSGSISASDCQGASGRVKVEQFEDPKYGWKNVVKEYVKPGDKAVVEEEFKDDDVPF